ncbi:hypothetical protein [Nitratireductor sp. GCM10026969]|uniref:hypothetical protein n=1 Tax=Nitratireductor sp. GCM10026969 TaxID=3252645 RepID=UPI003608F1CB
MFGEGGPDLIPNALGEVLTPSVVGVDEVGEILVGKAALTYLTTASANDIARTVSTIMVTPRATFS